MQCLLTKVQYYMYVFSKLKEVQIFLFSNVIFLCTLGWNYMKSLTKNRFILFYYLAINRF